MASRSTGHRTPSFQWRRNSLRLWNPFILTIQTSLASHSCGWLASEWQSSSFQVHQNINAIKDLHPKRSYNLECPTSHCDVWRHLLWFYKWYHLNEQVLSQSFVDQWRYHSSLVSSSNRPHCAHMQCPHFQTLTEPHSQRHLLQLFSCFAGRNGENRYLKNIWHFNCNTCYKV